MESASFCLISKIIAFKQDANILMFSMNAEETYAKKYLQPGAKGYLRKARSQVLPPSRDCHPDNIQKHQMNAGLKQCAVNQIL